MTTDDDNPAGPKTPRRASPNKGRTHNATPNRKASAPAAGVTPKSAPAATGRPRSATMKQLPPSLLSDFLLGRPSAARVAADKEAARQRRMGLEQVKQEMRQGIVQKVPAPGGVHDRVKQWQKKNATALTSADPLAAPSEPSEVLIQIDEESVTEEDRVRIKMRRERKPPPRVVEKQEHDAGDTEKENQENPRSGSPPKKRVVSDTNWMKHKRRTPPRCRSPKTKPESSGSPLPKDFLARAAPNPPVKNKIKDWATRVELPDEPRVKRYNASKSVGSGDGIRVKGDASDASDASERSEDEIVVETSRTHKSKVVSDDGIRGKPTRKKSYTDHGIRVRPQKTTLPDDGIRVQPLSTLPDDGIRVYSDDRTDGASTIRASSRQSRGTRKRAASSHRDASRSEKIEVIEESETDVPDTPTRKSSGKMPLKMGQKTAARSCTETGTTMTKDLSDTESWSSGSSGSNVESDRPSSAPSKLAEIPVGYSAFSELDLPLGGPSKRPKAKRNPSFKDATNVLKKAFTEGKKIITEKVEPPPKPVANQPRSIESWLNKTVDPFVDKSAVESVPEEPKKKSVEKERADESKARRSTSTSKRKSAEEVRRQVSSTADVPVESKEPEPKEPEEPEEPTKVDATTPTSGGLKRSRATRSISSPLKPVGKKGFRDKLKEAFRGESNGLKYPPLVYPSGAEEVDVDEEGDEDPRGGRRSAGSKFSRSSYDDDSSVSQEPSKPSTYPKRRPPTNGFHELSTIVSLESGSTRDSDLSSIYSDTTVTQTTALTRSTGTELSRHRTNKPGLKRRLTKHSDLVSVLSLPDESAKPGRSNSLRSAHSVRRSTTRLDTATIEGLLQEFAHDENLYQRELKTLVDGVIPVLLTQVVRGDGHGHASKDLFDSPSSKSKEDSLAKSVVNMGIALEKLKNAHRRCPLSNAHRLPQWLESVQSVYDNYLDVWRLDFQDLIVNLAPLYLDENDSLLNAMPRNEAGDVLNEDGERIDVAHLLKRPLVRVKWINKFIKGYRTVAGTESYEHLAADWEKLQTKVRRRHKEESARAVDNDAIKTDTSRVRNLKTLVALDNIKIDRFRQVYAKDSFALDLRHSNGQRLECQVELIFRDSQLFKSDPGDLLIRETGSHGRSWLLFAPTSGGHFSARKGDEDGQLVVMIRGKNDEWFEVLTLTTDNEEQVLDWVDILGSSPLPPAVIRPDSSAPQSLTLQSKTDSADIPLGERKHHRNASTAESPIRADFSPEINIKTTPSRFHLRNTSFPTTPTRSNAVELSTPSPEKTPTQDSYLKSRHPLPDAASQSRDEEQSLPLREGMQPDPRSLQKSPTSDDDQHDDDAPPPPAHRTLPSKRKSSSLSPPVELTSSRVKRRGSSPLKHEYHPSDVSSESSGSSSCSEVDYSGSDSSDDELEAADMPDTMPAISIKRSAEAPTESAISGSVVTESFVTESDVTGSFVTESDATESVITESVINESTVSLTPSASASQANLLNSTGEPPEYVIRSEASISYWDNKKGCWKDLWPDICSIVISPGLIEAYPLRRMPTSSGGDDQEEEERPLIALDLTPLVMLRNSTVVDLEIRSPVLSYARLYSKVMKIETAFFRFRAASYAECKSLYIAVHRARMDNVKYKALEEEARVRAFGQNHAPEMEGEGSSHRRSWFGRKNSYRVSARAPSQSAGTMSHSSGVSASSFLKRLMGGGNQSFNIAMSSVGKQSPSSSGENSIYTSSASSGTPPRSPSVSAANSGNAHMSLMTNNLKIRLHLLATASKWEDHGNCRLEISRPNQDTRQNLRKYQGMEKRVMVKSIPKKDKGTDKVVVMLDAVLGSRCFSRLGSRGILLNVWEEVKNENGEAGVAPKSGGSGGNVSKWCFQCASVMEANWIFGLVTQEVVIG